jgi:hypothetical protein
MIVADEINTISKNTTDQIKIYIVEGVVELYTLTASFEKITAGMDLLNIMYINLVISFNKRVYSELINTATST